MPAKAPLKKKSGKKPGKEKAKVAPVIELKSLPFWIGFDLGGTKMLACVLDKDYNLLGSARKSTNGSDGAIKGRKKIVTVIHEAIAAAGVDPTGLQGIGIGCPGLVNTEKGILLSAPNLGWNNMGLSGILKTAFKKPVAVLNDVDAGTFGEYKLGSGKGSRSLLGIFPGTGVGSGFVYDGKLVMGRHVSAMELGMIYMPGTHLGSPIPGAVLLEDMTSRLAIASQAGIACYRGQLPELDKKTRGNLRDIRSKALSAAYTSGEQAAITIFRNSITYLGMGIATVVNLLAPDRITLGGGLVEEMPQLYLTALKEEVDRYALPGLTKGIRYSLATLGGSAVAIGSVAWLRDQKGPSA
ncbi:glucokinase [Prosthecobacter fusiformis]|uniref:Glucokinase n=1 Tax=Prosthecobacter fusiformis TaxID=48464 RepID=A0A4R7RSU3_9BACT|nr:ROK family protein [Prosthecobacter fusiformis]TDU68209.1 glucokinase [Prosthecobacter fusiformis]